MVYFGRPSRGCQLCRKRKIKCDEGRPACSQCSNTKRACPGYVDQFDLVLRDQTEVVRRKAERTKQKGRHENKHTDPDLPLIQWDTSCTDDVADPSALDLVPPRSVAENPQELAICAFFTHFVLVPFHPDGQRGFLDCLLPLYTATRHDSLLSVATAAVALTISGGNPWRKADYQVGRLMFGKALRMAAAAIQDPVASTEDETLMAVLLLGFYERLGSAIMASKVTGTHEAGASALVKHRGKHNNKSEISTKLSLAVHTRLVEAAGQMQTSVIAAPLDLVQLGANLPRNTASRLTLISARVVNLSRFADKIFQSHSSPRAAYIDVVLTDANQIDAELEAWADSVSDPWPYHPATGMQCPVDQALEKFVYQGRMDFYEDINIANVWNNYRADKLTINRVILTCSKLQGFSPTHGVVQSARQAAQELVDVICASVPFHLGTKTIGGPVDREEVQYPYLGSSYLNRAQRHACAAYGGWYMLDSLKNCLLVDDLRKGQKGWIVDQIKRIGRLYSLTWTSYLSGKGKDKLSASEWEQEVQMACFNEKPAESAGVRVDSRSQHPPHRE